jgi:hypothetical protein
MALDTRISVAAERSFNFGGWEVELRSAAGRKEFAMPHTLKQSAVADRLATIETVIEAVIESRSDIERDLREIHAMDHAGLDETLKKAGVDVPQLIST